MDASEHLAAARLALLRDIEAFCAERNISESTFGGWAVDDGKFVARLKSDKPMTDRLIRRAQEFIQTERARAA
jgi:hypothetical protein